MANFLESRSIYYDDVNLIAQPQYHIRSRTQVPKQLDKVVISPMAAVVGEKFALAALKEGFEVCLPRFCDVSAQKKALYAIYDTFGKEDCLGGWNKTWVSVGLNDIDRVKELNHTFVLVDVANGYLLDVVNFVEHLKDRGYSVMVGNVHSAKGLNLYHCCDVRVGIGNGSVCDTARVTGYNRGQVTEIRDCVENRLNDGQIIVADGGIKSSGDIAKAFGLGADKVMIAGLVACAEEAENVIKGEYKLWGGASHTQQIKQTGKIYRHSEGTEKELDKTKIRPLKDIASDIWGGLSSAISYSGHANLTQFRGNGIFELKK